MMKSISLQLQLYLLVSFVTWTIVTATLGFDSHIRSSSESPFRRRDELNYMRHKQAHDTKLGNPRRSISITNHYDDEDNLLDDVGFRRHADNSLSLSAAGMRRWLNVGCSVARRTDKDEDCDATEDMKTKLRFFDAVCTKSTTGDTTDVAAANKEVDRLRDQLNDLCTVAKSHNNYFGRYKGKQSLFDDACKDVDILKEDLGQPKQLPHELHGDINIACKLNRSWLGDKMDSDMRTIINVICGKKRRRQAAAGRTDADGGLRRLLQSGCSAVKGFSGNADESDEEKKQRSAFNRMCTQLRRADTDYVRGE